MSRVAVLGRVVICLCLSLADPAIVEAGEFQYPVDVIAAADGTLYIADLKLPGIWKVTRGTAEVFVKGSKKFQTPLNAIRCLAIDADGKLLAGDSATREIYRISESGDLTPLTGGAVGVPICLAIGPEGDIYTSDLELRRIWKVPAAGGEPEEVALLSAVRGMAFDAAGHLWVARGTQPMIGKLRDDGGVVAVFEERTFAFTNQMTIGIDGTLYVADGYARTIWKVAPTGVVDPWIKGEPLVNPVGLAWRGKALLIADPRAQAIFEATEDGTLTNVIPVK